MWIAWTVKDGKKLKISKNHWRDSDYDPDFTLCGLDITYHKVNLVPIVDPNNNCLVCLRSGANG